MLNCAHVLARATESKVRNVVGIVLGNQGDLTWHFWQHFTYFTLKKLECSKQDLGPLYSSAWDNEKRQLSYFVGFLRQL